VTAQEESRRLLDLLELLHLPAGADELVPICSAGFPPKLPDQGGERLRRICKLIQQHLGEPLHRNEVARLAHFSPAAFSRFFKVRTGKTFHNFVTELRFGRACRLLGEHERNVTEIALACGFASVASFNHVLRRAKQVNQTHYRRKLQALN
jgi:transcriptional regulator GlxA family with amidase domain